MKTRLKLAIVSTHPIQYYSPVFRSLAAEEDLDIRVFYTWSQAQAGSTFDSGFGRAVRWDIPLLEGYAYEFVANVAQRPGPERFRGINTPGLHRAIEAWGAQAVLIYTWNSQAHLSAMRHFKGRIPVLFRGDSTLIDPRSAWRAALRRAVLTWIYRHVDVAIAVGTKNREYFEWAGIPADCIAVAPHSVDVVRFAADQDGHEQAASRWREDLGIGGDEVTFLFAGKLQSKKNPLLLLEAFRRVSERAHLVFAGNGELEETLKSRAGDLRNTHFLPFQNQSVMPAIYRIGDVFVLPSQGPEETWGLALNEAMASGRPVIASTRVGGACDLIRHGRNGWMFESGALEELSQLLERAVELQRIGLRSLGAAALADSRCFTSEESARQISHAVRGAFAGTQRVSGTCE